MLGFWAMNFLRDKLWHANTEGKKRITLLAENPIHKYHVKIGFSAKRVILFFPSEKKELPFWQKIQSTNIMSRLRETFVKERNIIH